MRSKPSAQVVGESYVELPRQADAFEKINVDHFNAAPVFALRATTGSLRPLFSLAMFPLRRLACQPKPPRKGGEGWWSQAESNRRPLECHSSALPTELWPRL